MKPHLVVFAVCLPILAHSQDTGKFDAMRQSAEPVGGLGAFLSRYVGQCSQDVLDGAECQQHAARFRSQAQGKKYYTVVSEESAQVSVGRMDGDDVDLLVTPFFGAANSALTQGAPRKTDARGNPVLPFLQVKAKVPEGMNAAQLKRLVSIRAVRLEVVFTPQGLWTLPKPGGPRMVGVRGRIEALLLSVGRTGQPLGSWYGR